MVVEAVAPPELAQDAPAEDDEEALPTVLAALLQRAHEQHERMRRRFCWTTMPSLLEAAKDADLPAAQRLLASGADPDAPTQIVDAAGGGRAAWGPMHFACRHGSLECVQVLVKCSADPHSSTALHGFSPLQVAYASGSQPVMVCLNRALAESKAKR